MKLIAGAVTDVGRVRTSNEDSFVIDERVGLFAVADGLGGHQAGEVASKTALETIRALVAGGRPIDEAVAVANTDVYEKAGSKPGLRGMGTTVTAVTHAEGDRIAVGHVGDSRAYLLRGTDFRQLTEDHSLVEELVREGRLTPEQASAHPQRSIITRALGLDLEVEIDTFGVDVAVGDRLLLCSDGLTTMVPPVAIADVLAREPDPADAAERLVEAANAAGGEDNVTAVVIDVIAGDSTRADRPETTAASPAVLPVEAPAAAAPRRRRKLLRPLGRGARRALLYLLPVLIVIGLAVAACGWYARNSYYVGFSGRHVTIFRGVPGGLLGWNPTIERRDELLEAGLTVAERVDLEDGHRFSSRSSAEAFVRRLVTGFQQRTTTTTTTTAVAASTTTASPGAPVSTSTAPVSTTAP
ncbi:MAG: Stp1/IreP family PP2C-type Ser/Thr phosphatase [Acidimicrobiia bacterium]